MMNYKNIESDNKMYTFDDKKINVNVNERDNRIIIFTTYRINDKIECTGYADFYKVSFIDEVVRGSFDKRFELTLKESIDRLKNDFNNTVKRLENNDNLTEKAKNLIGTKDGKVDYANKS